MSLSVCLSMSLSVCLSVSQKVSSVNKNSMQQHHIVFRIFGFLEMFLKQTVSDWMPVMLITALILPALPLPRPDRTLTHHETTKTKQKKKQKKTKETTKQQRQQTKTNNLIHQSPLPARSPNWLDRFIFSRSKCQFPADRFVTVQQMNVCERTDVDQWALHRS